MAKWDALRKTSRDKKWWKYWLKHQGLSHQECADHFNTSRTNFARVINNMKVIIERESGI